MLRLFVSVSLSWSIMSKNKSSRSRANMGTSVIYLCRLVLMAYFELPFVIAMMLAMKIEDDNT